MLLDYREMDGKQRWAINKLHRVTKSDSAPIIYFHFAKESASELVEVDLSALPHMADIPSSKAQRKCLIKGLRELESLGILTISHSHNWKTHTAKVTPLANLTKQLKGK